MSISVFMDLLERRGVTFDLVDGVLCVEAPLGTLSEAQRHELAARRDEVEALVCVALGPYAPMAQVAEAQRAQLRFGEAA